MPSLYNAPIPLEERIQQHQENRDFRNGHDPEKRHLADKTNKTRERLLKAFAEYVKLALPETHIQITDFAGTQQK
jgi:hypothetical protein